MCCSVCSLPRGRARACARGPDGLREAILKTKSTVSCWPAEDSVQDRADLPQALCFAI